MQRRVSAESPLRRVPGTWILVAGLVLCSCASQGPTRPDRVVDRDESGFTITDEVPVGEELRGEFRSAIAALQQGQYERGIALLLAIAEEEPRLTAVHIDLAIAYGRIDDLERAEASLERALELNPRHPVAYNELGILYRKTGRFKKARESYEKALALYPEFHFARRNLAILCDVYLSDLECALKHYEQYAEAVPGDQAAAIWIADLHNRAGR